jgi:hypothetical protein
MLITININNQKEDIINFLLLFRSLLVSEYLNIYCLLTWLTVFHRIHRCSSYYLLTWLLAACQQSTPLLLQLLILLLPKM